VSQRLEIALDASKVGVWEFDFVADKLVWDDRMNELYGLPRDNGVRHYSHWQRSLHPDDMLRAEAEFHDAIATGGRYHSEFRLLLPDGAVRVIRAIGAVYESAGTSHKIIGVNWDAATAYCASLEWISCPIRKLGRNADFSSSS